MRQIVVRGAKIAVAAFCLGLVGCDGGGIEEGMPKDLTPGVDPNMMKVQMNSRSAPPSAPTTKGAAPAGGAPTPTPKN
jgi:hypothetical protein